MNTFPQTPPCRKNAFSYCSFTAIPKEPKHRVERIDKSIAFYKKG
jgi:hypothetical protein